MLKNIIKKTFLVGLITSLSFGSSTAPGQIKFNGESKNDLTSDPMPMAAPMAETKQEIRTSFPAKTKDISSVLELKNRIVKEDKCSTDSFGTEICTKGQVNCNGIVEYTKGFSKKHESHLEKNLNSNYQCEGDYKKMGDKCILDYVYYTYECPIEINIDNKIAWDQDSENGKWQGPMNNGGDCFGKELNEKGECNSPEPEKENCVRVKYTCPLDPEAKCAAEEDKETNKEVLFSKKMYSNGFAKEHNNLVIKNKICKNGGIYDSERNKCELPMKKQGTEIKCSTGYFADLNRGNICISEPSCPTGTTETRFGCEIKYKWNSYSCEEGFKVKDKGKDCNASCGFEGCSCNSPVSPQGNCEKLFEIKSGGESFSKEETVISKKHNIEGLSKKFISNIESIEGLSNNICFNTNEQNHCLKIDNCNLGGKTYSKDFNLNNIHEIGSNGFRTNCSISGYIDNKTFNEIFIEKNKIELISNGIKTGEIVFVNELSDKDKAAGFKFNNNFEKLFNHGFVINKLEKDKTISIKNNTTEDICFNVSKSIKGSYTFNGGSCSIISEGDNTANSLKEGSKIKMIKKDYQFKCSSLSCDNGTCGTAACPTEKGIEYLGTTLPGGLNDEYLNKCSKQVCDKNKPFIPLCGATTECTGENMEKDMETGGCTEYYCEGGEFDPSSKTCVVK